MITYFELLQMGVETLQKANVPEPDLDAWYLFSECFHITRTEYFLRQKEIIEETEEMLENRKVLQEFLLRRSKREPLQYILGTQEFMGYSFFVTPSVLIPRQDTEVLVEKALSILKKGDRILDMCTGSGCILLSLVKRKELQHSIGVDISKEALFIAKKNADALNLNVSFYQSDLFKEIDKKEKFQMIVSNPPYITELEMAQLMPEVAEYEPRIALFGGRDGLDFYRKIAEKAGDYLEDKGYLILEIGCRQAIAVKEILQENGYEEIQVIQDLAGLDRIVAARKQL